MRDAELLPLASPEDWRMDSTGNAIVHRQKLREGSVVYTIYEIRRVTWCTSVKQCIAELARRLKHGWDLKKAA